jgi:MoxR-like ATPase
MSDTDFQVYEGNGESAARRGKRLPAYEQFPESDSPEGYLADEGLRDAVNVALLLGQPLLVTGDPGTGKTQLAWSVAYELGLGRPLAFNTKTTSTARDLFYRYDALAHFHDARFREGEAADLPADKYITYEALGLAILLAMPPGEADAFLPDGLKGAGPARSVVLIDEVDKAPRDLPNDVLNEIEGMTFTVRETGRTFTAPAADRPIIIMTSNAEKNLPEPFLRRCVFYHIKPPDEARLAEIARRRLGPPYRLPDATLKNALRHFSEIRDDERLRKKPSTAELLAWLRVLAKRGIDPGDPAQARQLASTYPVLLKFKEDLEVLTPEPARTQDST